MTSYISTQSISNSMRQSILRMQSDLAASQTEVSTGKYADLGLSLGVNAGLSVSLQSETSLLQTISDSNEVVSTRLSTTQNVLSGLQSSAQSLLNSLIEANGSTTSSTTLQTSATANLKSLISSLNSSINGDYIFAGTNTGTRPISDYFASNASSKQAVDDAFQTQFGITQQSSSVADISQSDMQSFIDGSFSSLFTDASWSNTWSSASSQVLSSQISRSQSVNTSVTGNSEAFRQLAQAYTVLSELGTQNLSSGAFSAVVGASEKLLTSAITSLTSMQSTLGVAQQEVTDSNSQMSLQMNLLSTQVSGLESVDPYEVSVRVTNLQTQIETSYSLTSQLSQLSLTKFL
ncbi:flagellar hook-associated family protein [Methylocapsa acidiphila]|uniref:flagellar hook-associated family protein n=1 Tax=Methylocapsa acidiphila TaxID=133552 RepID=UPI000A06CEB7|nr:flagellar hook-associated family protein [Methylocapsa acidiphila]